MYGSIPQTPSNKRVFGACLLSFAILISPMASVASTYPGNRSASKVSTKSNPTTSSESSPTAVGANPEAFPAPQPLPAPEPLSPPLAPAAGAVTATLSAALTVTANNADLKADPGDTINYTVQLGNTTGSSANGLNFNVTLDSHTTLLPGLNSTPVAFDQAVNTNEDVPLSITISGQDPDGSNLTFKNGATNLPFGASTATTNGTLGTFSAPDCATTPGICTSTATYTPTANYNGPDSFTFFAYDGTSNSNQTGTVTITVNAVNDAPSFTTPGNPAAVLEDAGATTVTSFITNVSPGPANESGQTVNFVIDNNSNPGLFSSAPALNVVGASYPKTANLTYTPKADQNGTAIITYHLHDNGGTSPGVDNSSPNQTFTITVTAVNDPPVVTPPAAFAIQANMKRTGLGGLLASVSDADSGVNGCVPTPFTIKAGSISATSPAGGTISNVNLSAGTFDFDPPPGVTGPVTFTYIVKDNGCPGTADSAPVTVTLNVSGPVIWFVDPNRATDGNGTLSDTSAAVGPFKLLSSANAKLATLAVNQRVFVYSGSTTVGATEVLLLQGGADQTAAHWLIGQGAIAADFDTLFGLTGGAAPPAGTIARPTINGTRPTIKGTVTMKNNTVVRGVNIDVSAGSTKGLTSSGFTSGTATISDVNVTSAAGNAVDLSGTQTVNYTTSDATNSPNILVSTTGIALSVVNTTIGVSGFTFKSISASGGSKGIVLNTTGTTGGLTVTGTGTTAGSGGTIQNTTARGGEFISTKNLSLANMNFTNATTADGADPTVQSGTCGVAHSGGSNTGCNAPIFMDGVNTASLNTVTVSGSSQMGININASNDLTMNAVNVSGAGNNPNEFGMNIHNLTGTNNWSGINIHDNLGANHQVYVEANSTSSTGTFNITGSSQFTCVLLGGVTRQGGNLLSFDGYGTSANMAVTVTGATFSGSSATALLFHTQQTSGNSSLNVGTSSFTNNNSQIDISKINGATVTYNVHDNATMTGANFGEAINVASGNPSSGTMSGTISNNVIGNAGVAGSGCTGGCGGIFITTISNGTITANILNNHISRVSSNAINATAGQISTGNTNTINVNITGNTIDNPDVNTVNAIFIESGTSSTQAAAVVCATIGDVTGTDSTKKNIINGNWGGGQFDPFDAPILLRNRFAIDTFRIAGWSPTSGVTNSSHDVSAQNFVISHNTITANSGPNGTGHTVSATVGATAYTGGAPTSCPLLLAEGGVMAALNAPSLLSSFDSVALSILTNGANDTRRPIVTAPGVVNTSLGQQQLDSIVSNAIARWSATGLTQQQLAALRGIRFEVTDLEASYLGEADGNRILVDRNADGKGWFTGSGPLSDSLFHHAVSTTRRYTDPMSAPAGHVDLLTAIMHEMGHRLGLDDIYSESERDSLMYGHLTVGERRLPARDQAKYAQPGELKGSHFLSLSREHSREAMNLNLGRDLRTTTNFASIASMLIPPVPGTFPVNGVGSGFQLPDGKTVTITFSVTLNNPPNLSGVPPATPQVSAFGTLSGTNVSGFNTNTVNTAVDLFNSTTTVTSLPTSSNTGQAVTFTAAIGTSGSPSGAGTNRTGTVVFKDGGTPIPCSNVGGQTVGAVSPNQATCTTSSLTTATHVITAEYSGDGNFDPSNGTLSGGQVVTQSGTSTTVGSSQPTTLVTQSVTFTATVASSTTFTGPPTGNVDFYDGAAIPANLISGCSARPLNGSAAATCTTSSLNNAGSPHTIRAVYNGDTNFTTSFGTVSQTVDKSNTTTALGSSSNPSIPTQTVTYTATVSSATSVTGPFTGTVTFKDNNVAIVCEAGSQTLTSGGVATCKFTYPSAATHPITAVYSGDGTFNTSTSTPALSQVVSQTATTTALGSSQNPSAPTNPVTFTATVSAANGTPTGTVTFKDNNVDIPNCSPTLNPVPLASSQAQCTVPGGSFTETTHPITAVYSGDTVFSGSTSNTVNQLVTSCTASVVVINTNDSGPGSLRQAILSVCDGGTITFDSVAFAVPGSYTIDLSDAPNNELLVSKNMTITGPGASVLTVRRAIGAVNNFRVFEIAASKTVTISGMTISNGNVLGAPGGAGGPGGAASGGGIFNAGTLTLTNAIVSGNHATGGDGGASATTGGAGGDAKGGGIFSNGTLTLTNTTVNGSSSAIGGKGGDSAGTNGNGGAGYGGGVYSVGTLTLTNSTIASNTATGGAAGGGAGVAGSTGSGSGGGIYNDGATAAATTVITKSAINGNSASLNGGGTFNIGAGANATLTLTNSTISGNTGNNNGGGIYNDGATGTTTLTSVTVTGNSADNDFNGIGTGGGINVVSGTLTLKNTIVAGNLKGSAILQVETATVIVPTTITTAGNAKVIVTAVGMTNSPKTVFVAVANGDDASAVALAMRTALTADVNVNAFFTVSGAADKIILTARTVAANDATLNIETNNDTSVGLTPAPTSADTQPGRPAHDIAGTINTVAAASMFNLIGDAGSSGGLTDGIDSNIVGIGGAGVRHITTILNSLLADNGGPTNTHALVNGSPAIDKGDDFSGPPTTDQRGFPRPVNFDSAPPAGAGDDSDIGAFERQIPPAAPATPDLKSTSDSGTSQTDNITKTTPRVFDIASVTSGATVELLRGTSPGGGGEVVAASAVASSSSISLSDTAVLPDGDYYYRARQTLGSDTSPLSPIPGLKVTIDTTAPPTAAPDLQAGSDTGTSQTDNLTNKTPRLFDITGTENGALVELLRGATVVDSTTSGGGTVVLTDSATLADGPYSYTTRQTDIAGNVATSSALIVTIDTSAPTIPGTPDLQAGSDSGVTTDNLTNKTPRLFNVSFTAEAGSTIVLLRNGTPVTGASDSGASSPVTLTDGDSPADNTYLYSARITDASGNSSTSLTLSVTIDTTAPTTAAPDLKPGSDSGASNTDNVTNAAAGGSRLFDITGTENGATVELYRGATLVSSTTGTGGTVTLTDGSTQVDGSYDYTTKQTDIAGNAATSTILTVTIDTLAPAQPATPDLQASSDTGPSSTDNITNHAAGGSRTFDLAFTQEANSTIELLRNGAPVASGSGASSTLPLSDPNALSDGTYAYRTRHTDLAGNFSTSASPLNVTIDTIQPTVSMTSALGDPTSTTPIPVTVTFSEAVFGFTAGDITPSNGVVGNFVGADGSTSYTFDLTPSAAGPVSANIAAGVATDTAGNNNTVALQFTRTYDPSALNAVITAVSPNPRNVSVSSIQIVFNKAVTGFDLADLTLKRDASGNLLTGAQTLTSGDNKTWTLGNLSGVTGTAGTYVLKLTASGSNIIDSASNPLASDATATWVMDTTAPDVTINQKTTPPAQADPVTGPTAGTVINFTAIFTEPVTDFTNSDVIISGTAGATVVNVSGSGTTYNVAVEGMTQSGTVIVSIPAGSASDIAGNLNTVSTSTDNTVTFFADNFTTFQVNSLADTNDGFCTALGSGPGANQDCTLREAINAANTDAGAETITFAPALTSGGPATISLLTALADITTDMTIQGPGANLLTVERNAAAATKFRVFTTNSTAVTISGLTISKGFTADGAGPTLAGGDGGGVLNSGTLNLTSVTVSGNRTGAGNTTGRGGKGGGIYNTGTLVLTRSTVSGNTAGNGGAGASLGGDGGGIGNTGTLTVNNSTISGNNTGTGGVGGTGGRGGGIWHNTATLTITGGTITLNHANGTAASGGGIQVQGGTATIKNTIVGGGNTAATGPDVNGAVNSEGFNLIQSTSSAAITETLNVGTNITGQDPLLFPLADNGGGTMTHALQCVSPAIDKGFKFTLTTDQRGGIRPFDLGGPYTNAPGGDGSDIGAYEVATGGGCLPVAVPPTPAPSTNEDTTVQITLKGTYSQNSALTFIITQQPTHSTAPLTPSAPVCTFTTFQTCTSTVSYTPSLNYNGPDSLKFKVSASGLDSEEVDVNITVIPVNDVPIANSQSASTAEDTPLPITLSGSDVESPITFSIVTGPAHGSFGATTPPNLIYTPAPDYNGVDSFTFKVNDGTVDSNIATVSLTITAVNDAPTAVNDALSSVAEDSGMRTITIASLLANDSKGPANESTQTLTFTLVGASEVGGTISRDATNVYFTPTADYNGPASFQYTVTDNGTTNGAPDPKTSAPATVSFTVTEVNDAPTAVSETISNVAEDSGQRTIPFSTLTANDSKGPANESGQTLIVKTVSNPVGGTVSILGGNVLFTPASDYNGPASFDYTVEDNGTTNGVADPKTSGTATASFTIWEVNDAPTAVNDTLSSVAEDSGQRTIPFSVLLSNDSSGPANESGQTLTVKTVSNPVGGTVSIVAGTVRFTPAANFNGTATFQYTVEDNGTTNGVADPKTSAPAFVHFVITEVNDAPTAVNDTLSSVAEDSGQRTIPFTTLTANDSKGPANESGQTLIVKTVSNAVGGTVSIVGGNVLFTPTADFNGAASFDYTVEDNGTTNGIADPLTSAPATVSFTITEVNDAPTAVNDTLSSVAEDSGQRTIPFADLTGNDSRGPANESGQTLIVKTVSNAVGGTVSIVGGNVLFTPTANFNGAASFQYTVEDNGTTNGVADPKTSAPATVSFTITPVADTPSVTNATTNANTQTTSGLVISRNPADGAEVTHFKITGITGGTLFKNNGTTVINNGDFITFAEGNAGLKFTPGTSNGSFLVQASLSASDAGLGGGTALATITINALGGVIRFSSANYSVAEGAGFKTITVERTGDTSQAVTVDYATSDHSNPADFIPCTAAGAGFASSRCDFTTAVGTLRFAAGETSKTFNVLISQDNYVEGTETLDLTLSNLTGGAVFGVPSTAILSILDDATEPATNPIDTSSEFVRSQYHDILHREPDPAGLAFWTDNIEKCNDPARRPSGQTAAQCIDKQRESTAVAFFFSPEFQITGGFVYHLYKGSLPGSPNYDGGSPGRFPTSLEFMRDVSTVSEGIVVNNQISGAMVEANRNQLAAEFVQRPEFLAKYGGLNNTLYVQELFNTTGIAATPGQKQALVDGLNNSTETRASVLRKVVDGTVVINEANVQFTTTYGQAFFIQEYRRMFVFMEYVGYLRRNPDTAGFKFWLGKLNFYNGDPFQAEMVRSFILSPEYRSRFGTP